MVNLKKIKINDQVVHPIRIKKYNGDEVKGYDVWPTPYLYGSMFILARKQSGKTSTIRHIIMNCTNKNTHLFVFCPNYECDPTWIEIQKELTRKKIPASFFCSIEDHGIDQLDIIVKDIQDEIAKEHQQEEEEDNVDHDPLHGKGVLIDYSETNGDMTIKIKQHKREPKLKTCKYMFIIDDLAPELKRTSVDNLNKIHRHISAKIIISSQYIHDLLPSTRSQIDSYIIFPGINDDKLDELYKYSNLSIDEQTFKHLYHDATTEKYNFLYITTIGDYRANFNHKYILE